MTGQASEPQAPLPFPAPAQSLAPRPRPARYAFIDWYRGFACLLMFQTHAYDAWTADAFRSNGFWWTSRHLGGFPSRLFLLLAGVSLMLRFDADRRKNVPLAASRRGAALRGLEVLALGYLFRITEWLLGGAQLAYVWDVCRVDILNCIGLSLIVAAYVVSPRDLEPGRVPWRTAGGALGIALITPYIERFALRGWGPRPLTSYIAGARPMAFFPLFPWLSYTLAGCAIASLWVCAARRERLGRAIAATLGIGAVMAIIGQIAHQAHRAFYDFGDRSAPPTSPSAFFYRTGMCLLGVALAYLATRKAPPERFSPMRQLGRTSLLVYWVHVELVYGHLSDRIAHRLSLLSASLLLALLTAAMLGLSWLRTEYFSRAKPARPRATAQKSVA